MSTTLATPGNIVVPLSTILDQLKGKLTDVEINQLVAAIVGARQTEVRPGDLITSALVNQMLHDIDDLLVRVAKLEGVAAGPVIFGLSPTGDIPILGGLTVLGSGFDSNLTNNTVLLGSVPITAFLPGSTATQLIIQVPDQFPTVPTVVGVSVRVGTATSNTVQVRLVQQVSQQGGQVVLTSRTPPLGTVATGTPISLLWTVDSQTALPVNYNLDLVFTGLGGPPDVTAWRAASRLTPTGTQQIVRGSSLAVTASVTVPANATQGSVSLRAQSTDGLFSKTSDPITLTVGSAPAISDPRASVTIGSVGPFDSQGNPNPLRSAKITVSGSQLDGLQLLFGRGGTIPVLLALGNDPTAPGDYFYSAQVETPAAAWQITSVVPASHTGVPGSGTRNVAVTLANVDTTNSNAVTFLTIRAQHHPPGSATGDFVSFVRVPIQGVSS
jgi:hypothetical protein